MKKALRVFSELLMTNNLNSNLYLEIASLPQKKYFWKIKCLKNCV